MEISSMDHAAVHVLPEDDERTTICTGGLDESSLLRDGDETSIIIDALRTKMDDAKVGSTVPTIYRVPDILRNLNPNAYEPKVISLGPYHRDKPKLKSMDKLKCQCLRSFLRRNPDVGLDEYVRKVKELKDRVRNAYSEAPSCKENEFIEMMLLDACFVLEILIYPDAYDNRWEITFVYTDMLLLENQIPFFLLKELLRLNCEKEIPSLTKKIYDVFWDLLPGKIRIPSTDLDRYHHILHLLVSCAAPESSKAKQSPAEEKDKPSADLDQCHHILHLLVSCAAPESPKAEQSPAEEKDKSSEPSEPTLEWIPGARGLHESGVVFRKKERYESFLDITFQGGAMEIPPLQIFRNIESVFRNLIAFEQCFNAADPESTEGLPVTAYACLMDFIINTSKDVEKLDGIIVSTLGNDEKIADLFNELCVEVPFDANSYLSGVYKSINHYRGQVWNRNMAMLRHNYFNNPWAWISVIAAILLFLLTIMQTVLSFVDYLHPI